MSAQPAVGAHTDHKSAGLRECQRKLRASRLGGIAVFGVAALVLSACTTAPSSTNTASANSSSDAPISVISTTNVYSSLAQLVGGSNVKSDSLITSSAQDPHDFEPSAEDSLAVKEAGVVIENGGGYDDPVSKMVQDAGLPKEAVINAVDISGLDVSAHDGKEGNEHVFYSLPALEKVATAVHDRLVQLRPGAKTELDANLAKVNGKLGQLKSEVQGLRSKGEGRKYLASEPIADYLFDDAGLSDATPEAFSSAIDQEHDASASAIKEMNDLLNAKSVAFLSLNTQTETNQTSQLGQTAKKASVPVLDYTETITDGKDILTWMDENVKRLEGAL